MSANIFCEISVNRFLIFIPDMLHCNEIHWTQNKKILRYSQKAWGKIYGQYIRRRIPDSQSLEELESEYKWILQRLDNLEGQGFIGAFDKRTIIELSNDVMKEITHKYENLQKGIGGIMGGHW